MNLWRALSSGFLAAVWLEASLRLRGKTRRVPQLTMAICLVLVFCLHEQLSYPQLLIVFERSAAKVSSGEWWRLVTALFFQDGWITGGSTNILLLFAIGNLTEQVRSRPDWLITAASGAAVGELVGLHWEPVGAGNSIVTCSIAGSLVELRSLRTASLSSKILRIVVIVICLVLIGPHDIHGAAAATGFLVGRTRAIRWQKRLGDERRSPGRKLFRTSFAVQSTFPRRR